MLSSAGTRCGHLLASRFLRRQRLRSLHVPATAALQAIEEHVSSAVETHVDSQAGPALSLRFTASRQANSPVVELRRGRTQGPDQLVREVQIGSDSIPDECKEFVEQSGTSGAVSAVEGIWRAFRTKDWLRLSAELGSRHGTTSISELDVEADDFAIYRQPYLQDIARTAEMHPLRKKAVDANLFYHKSPSGNKANIGSYGYGAGVAMATMDALAAAGGKPANFLDGGGGATEANVRAAMNLVLSDSDLKVIFVNSFGGLTKTDLIAKGIVDVLRERVQRGESYPEFVVRLRGTGEDEAKRILEAASELKGVQVIPGLKEAASAAVKAAAAASRGGKEPASAPEKQPIQQLSPVVFSKEGQYERTRGNLAVKEGAKVLVLGTGKASVFHNGVAQKFGTNIVAACAPNKGGTTFLDRPVYGQLREAVSAEKPDVVSLFVPYTAAADSVIECIEAEIPLVVTYAEGIPQYDQLRVQAAMRSQSKTRVMGANCPGMIIPREKVKLGIQPLAVHSPGIIGLASRSGTISYELASQTSQLGLGQSIVFGLGGDPFPGTRTWEALDLMLKDDHTKVICLVGEIGGQMEEEAAEVYREYLSSLSPGHVPKPVVGFIAGSSTQRGQVYGHAGAVWWTDAESAESKKQCWRDAGIILAPTLGEVGAYIFREAKRLGVASS